MNINRLKKLAGMLTESIDGEEIGEHLIEISEHIDYTISHINQLHNQIIGDDPEADAILAEVLETMKNHEIKIRRLAESRMTGI